MKLLGNHFVEFKADLKLRTDENAAVQAVILISICKDQTHHNSIIQPLLFFIAINISDLFKKNRHNFLLSPTFHSIFENTECGTYVLDMRS